MKKLVTIFTVLFLAGISFAVPTVTPPLNAPSWWNEENLYYAYAWGSSVVTGSVPVSPLNTPTTWASNYLENTDFTAAIDPTTGSVLVRLGNDYHADLYKKIFVYITGTTTNSLQTIETVLHTDNGIFFGTQTWNIGLGNGVWEYVLEGEVYPQPAYIDIAFTVTGASQVTNIWAGESSGPVVVPAPGAMVLAGIGVSLVGWVKRRKSI